VAGAPHEPDDRGPEYPGGGPDDDPPPEDPAGIDVAPLRGTATALPARLAPPSPPPEVLAPAAAPADCPRPCWR
jgi:hypothetical protein